MENETRIDKNNGKCRVWQASNTNRLKQWITAIRKKRYTHLNDENDGYSITVMSDDENKSKSK